MSDPIPSFPCFRCGAMIAADMNKHHDQWHEYLEFMRTALHRVRGDMNTILLVDVNRERLTKAMALVHNEQHATSMKDVAQPEEFEEEAKNLILALKEVWNTP
jgi:hypothetical protein